MKQTHMMTPLLLLLSSHMTQGFTHPSLTATTPHQPLQISRPTPILKSSNEPNEALDETFGGYTVKQRLREEVESPFRKVRLIFFASSAGSALTALYFSATNALKATMGTYPDSPSLDDSLTSCAINLGGAIVCGFLALRDYRIGQANLERIARGGQLARLGVISATNEGGIRTLTEYRRTSRVLICAGGKEYISQLSASLNSDQRSDENGIAEGLASVDMFVVPVLLEESGSAKSGLAVGDTQVCWKGVVPAEGDRNFDVDRANEVIGFPRGIGAWTDYLQSEIETASNQGFDVLGKGFNIVVKKNGKILRRITGLPRWTDLIGTMEVMDGSRFGMPGDSERYGGP